jgi:hypothetical protein
VPVLDDVAYALTTGVGLFDVSCTGTFIYRRSRVDATAMATVEWVDSTDFVDTNPSFSPDGRWLAYVSNESGKPEVYVRAFPPPSSGQGGKWQVSNNGGVGPHWSRTGNELVYRSGSQLMTASYSVKGDTFVAEKPRVWIAALGGTMWDLAPDGKRVAVVIPEGSAQAPQQEHEIVVLQNFSDELRRRVPLSSK